MSVPDPQYLKTEALIFAASPAWLDFFSPVETVAFKLTMTPLGANLQKTNCIIQAQAETLGQAGLLSLPYILMSRQLIILRNQRAKALLFRPSHLPRFESVAHTNCPPLDL